MVAGTFVVLATTDRSDETPSRAATRTAGAQVGAVIGMLAVLAAAIPVLVGGSFQAWVAVSVPAGGERTRRASGGGTG
jgi:hypothetical protein